MQFLQFMEFLKDPDSILAAKKLRKEAIDPLALKGGLNRG